MKTKILNLFLLLVTSMGTMFAEKVQIGNLYYNLDATNQTAEVTSQNDSYPYWSTTLSTADIPTSVTYMGKTYSVRAIGGSAFSCCSTLTSVTIENGVISIGEHAFESCTSLTSVTIPNSIISIGRHAFESCTSLTSVIIPNSVISIEEYSFDFCSSLSSVTIGNHVTSIGFKAFECCNSLTSLTIGNSVTSIGKCAFEYCRGLTSVTIPNSVISIEKYAFHGCSSLTSLIIPNSVISIGEGAFSVCKNLSSIVFGTGIKVVEPVAFGGCRVIETIICYSQLPPAVTQLTFDGLPYNTIIYVPADYLETYKAHDFWGLYDVRPLGAKSTETTNVNVNPTENTAEVAWPAVSGAATYELVIKDKSGNVICTLIFNAQGQLTSIAFNAPSRNNAPQQTQAAGFAFTITGLNRGTSYDLVLTSKNSNGETIQTKTVSFTTTGNAQSVENILGGNAQSTKILRNGQLFILRGEKTYTLQGQEVK